MTENLSARELMAQLDDHDISEPPYGCYLGLVPYGSALEMQQRIHQAVVEKRSPGVILGLEHPSTITMGLHAKVQDLGAGSRAGENSNLICFATIDRGGQITGHEPGQLVIYPILPLGKFGVRKFVRLVEQTTVQVLKKLGLDARVDSARPGVWIQERKVCALGFRIKNKVAMHGLALNINNDLSIFQNFIPCGLPGVAMTSLARELGQSLVLEEVFNQWLKEFIELGGTPMTPSPY